MAVASSDGLTEQNRERNEQYTTVSQAICAEPDGIIERESTVLSLLQRANRVFTSAGQLEVFRADGNRNLVFVSG